MDALNLCANVLHNGLRTTDAFVCGRGTVVSSLLLLLFSLTTSDALGAGHRTENFIVTAPTKSLAQEIGDAAEQYRRDLAYEWLGEALPRWSQPCPINVKVGRMGAGGATSFMFERGVPFGWRMSIQGSRERILDSVLPHEVTHTIFATHFGRPLPRWADEGACTTVEHDSERARQDDMLVQFLKSDPPRSIPFNQMYRMTEYPHDILPLYAQGHSVARFLLQHGGKRKFIDYVGNGMQTEDWDRVTREFYGYRDLSELQLDWIDWVGKGSPNFGDEQNGRGAPALASNRPRLAQPAASTLTITTPLPPLLRPTDKEIESVRNAMSRDARGTQRSPAPSGDSWYARPRSGPAQRDTLESNLQPETPRVASVPRSFLPPANYPDTPTPKMPSNSIQWHRVGGARNDGKRLGTFKPELSEPDREPIRYDAPTNDTFWR